MGMTPVDELNVRAQVEVKRIVAILAAIADVRAAREKVKIDTLSISGEYLALERLIGAEAKLVDLVMEPGFEIYQRHLLTGFCDVLGGAA